MSGWCYADIWESIAAAVPGRAAQIQGERVVTWRDFDRRANAIARFLLDAGLTHQSKLAAFLYNSPEYLESYYACFKAGFAPVNTNYRYGDQELTYLFDNADAEAVVFHANFAPVVDQVRAKLPKVKSWLAVALPGHPVPDWADDYEAIASKGADQVVAPWGRSGDDVLLMYTGGTTGMPKGVMWRQEDLFKTLGGGGNLIENQPPLETVAEAGERAKSSEATGSVLRKAIAAAPLMHATAQFTCLSVLTGGGTVITLPSNRFNAVELFSEVDRLRASSISIVGLAFAAPMLETLDANPGRWDLTCLRAIGSSGTVWSHENKQGLLKYLPEGCILFDSLGSSEAVGIGGSSSTAGAEADTAKFMLGLNTAVFTEDGRRVEPGSGWLPARRLLQGPGKVGQDLPHLRGAALVGAWRLRHPQRRRHVATARPRLPGDQYRRRKGLSRRGRGSAEETSRCTRRGGGGRAGSSLRRTHLRGGRTGGRCGATDPGRSGRLCPHPAGRLQGPARSGVRPRVPLAQRQGRL
jgi:acyl-CoA synthetase (AMP-forming)/AMP-acid ligase II